MAMEYVKNHANYIIKPLIFKAALVLSMEALAGQEYTKDRMNDYLRQRQAQMQSQAYYRQQRAAAPRYIIKLRPDGAVVIDQGGGRSVATYHRFGRSTPNHIFIRDRNNPATIYHIDQSSQKNPAVARRVNFREELERAKRNIQAWVQRNR